MKPDPRERLIVALDIGSLDEALVLVRALGEEVLWYKVGLELFGAAGPEAVRALKREGKKVFLDLKLHDIPNTVAQAVSRLATVGADLLDMHTAAGPEAMTLAAARLRESVSDADRPPLLGVTVLTSSKTLAGDDAPALSRAAIIREAGSRATAAKEAGLDGVVAPALAVREIRLRCGDEFAILVPGIRPHGAERGDQQWIATPAEAIDWGARWIVVGRPITAAADAVEAARGILDEIAAADSARRSRPRGLTGTDRVG